MKYVKQSVNKKTLGKSEFCYHLPYEPSFPFNTIYT